MLIVASPMTVSEGYDNDDGSFMMIIIPVNIIMITSFMNVTQLYWRMTPFSGQNSSLLVKRGPVNSD